MAHASSKVNPPLTSAFSPFTSHVSRFFLFDSSGDLFTQDNEGFLNRKLPALGGSKTNFVTFVSFCLIRSRRYHSGYAVLEDRLMEVDEQSDRDMQQLHVTEELRFAEWMQNFDTFSSRSRQLSTIMSKRNGSSKTSPLYSIRTNCCVIEGIERSSSSRSIHRS